MIELSFATAFMLYLLVTIGTLLTIWVIHHYKSRDKKVIIDDKSLTVCEYCHYAYLEERGKKLSKCPQCHSFNHINVGKN